MALNAAASSLHAAPPGHWISREQLLGRQHCASLGHRMSTEEPRFTSMSPSSIFSCTRRMRIRAAKTRDQCVIASLKAESTYLRQQLQELRRDHASLECELCERRKLHHSLDYPTDTLVKDKCNDLSRLFWPLMPLMEDCMVKIDCPDGNFEMQFHSKLQELQQCELLAAAPTSATEALQCTSLAAASSACVVVEAAPSPVDAQMQTDFSDTTSEAQLPFDVAEYFQSQVTSIKQTAKEQAEEKYDEVLRKHEELRLALDETISSLKDKIADQEDKLGHSKLSWVRQNSDLKSLNSDLRVEVMRLKHENVTLTDELSELQDAFAGYSSDD